jgi:hypothetical protein
VVRVRPHRGRIQDVQRGARGLAAGRDDVGGHSLQRFGRAAGEEHPRTLAAEGARAGATDGAAAAMDDHHLVLQ